MTMLATATCGMLMKRQLRIAEAQLENAEGTRSLTFDRVLVAMGRSPVRVDIGLENLGITTDKHGFIQTDEQQRTGEKSIFAVGDAPDAGHGDQPVRTTAFRRGQ